LTVFHWFWWRHQFPYRFKHLLRLYAGVVLKGSRLSAAQQEIIARDFDMRDRCLEVKTRAPLVAYMLKAFSIDPNKLDPDPIAQQIVVANMREIKAFLF
jgi:hypothetical protein